MYLQHPPKTPHKASGDPVRRTFKKRSSASKWSGLLSIRYIHSPLSSTSDLWSIQHRADLSILCTLPSNFWMPSSFSGFFLSLANYFRPYVSLLFLSTECGYSSEGSHKVTECREEFHWIAKTLKWLNRDNTCDKAPQLTDSCQLREMVMSVI